MSVDKSKDTTVKKPAAESKAVEHKTVEAKAVEAKAETPSKVETPSAAETTSKDDSKPDATPKRQGMGEGQKPVSKAYKDNWNDIFGKKKKR